MHKPKVGEAAKPQLCKVRAEAAEMPRTLVVIMAEEEVRVPRHALQGDDDQRQDVREADIRAKEKVRVRMDLLAQVSGAIERPVHSNTKEPVDREFARPADLIQVRL